jgi:hypothetical protein
MQTHFYLIKTKVHSVFNIKHDDFFVGSYDIKERVLILKPKKVFQKHNGFGAHKELIDQSLFVVDKILIIYQNSKYPCNPDDFFKYGKEETFPEGIKIFLPIEFWERNFDQQGSLFGDQI